MLAFLMLWATDGVSYDTGAMLGIPAMTAHRCVYNSGDIKDRYVLITGGAGKLEITVSNGPKSWSNCDCYII